jgi:hypothetical protein
VARYPPSLPFRLDRLSAIVVPALGRQHPSDTGFPQFGSDRRQVPVRVTLFAVLLTAPGLAGVPAPQTTTGPVRADSSGVLTGVLIGREDGQPVPYGTVLVVEASEERFTDASGAFRIGGIAPGRYTVRARQIGYAPRDTIVEIVPAPAVTSLSIVLARLPVVLRTVRVDGHTPDKCVTPGIPDSAADPALARLFTQVGENVDRYRLLMQEYPFRFAREEQRFIRYDPTGTPRDVRESADTMMVESRLRRPYHIGGILYHDKDARGVRQLYMYIPTFGELGDPAFLSAHCFRYGGTVSPPGSAGIDLIRLDFVPLDRIKQPDVSGSIYLDAQRLTVRRAEFGLTKPEAVHPSIGSFKVTTSFRELVPLVPLMDSIESEQGLSETPVTREAISRYRVLDVEFEEPAPGANHPDLPPWPPPARSDSGTRARGQPAAPTSP